jgi:hypothetical protein
VFEAFHGTQKTTWQNGIDCLLKAPHEFHKGNLMLTVMCKRMIQQSVEAVSDTIEIRKPFPDVYTCLPLLRITG